jgi:tRNA pseudouridine38-40 synthase
MRGTFHARHSARAKTYEYRISFAPICPPFLARYVYTCPWPLDVGVLQRAAKLFEGTHDFLSFAATDPDLSSRSLASGPEFDQETEAPTAPLAAVSTVRTIFTSIWERRQSEAGEILVYRVRGSGFLHHMVRNLVGTMIDMGRGLLSAEEIPGILAARSRSAAGPTAPARGLFLHSVEYDEQE